MLTGRQLSLDAIRVKDEMRTGLSISYDQF